MGEEELKAENKELEDLLRRALDTGTNSGDAWEVWMERACELTGTSPRYDNPHYGKWLAKQQGNKP